MNKGCQPYILVHRRGTVDNRSQVQNPKTVLWTK